MIYYNPFDFVETLYIILKVLVLILENINKIYPLDLKQQRISETGHLTVSYFGKSYCFGICATSRKTHIAQELLSLYN